jgi:ribosome-associated toxin RatA of RatAB toxin-antitoxin module
MHSDIAIEIDAPPSLVFALAHDVERWATLLPHYSRSSVVARRPGGEVIADFVARRRLIPLLGIDLPVTWRSRTSNDRDEQRLYFVHVAGATKGMDVRWAIEPDADGSRCRVTIEHEFSPPLPGFAWFVDRFFTRPIAGRTLATFKALAEAVAGLDAMATSDPRSEANPST